MITQLHKIIIHTFKMFNHILGSEKYKVDRHSKIAAFSILW